MSDGFDYPVKLERAGDGGFTGTFPDVPEAITAGDTVEEALTHASTRRWGIRLRRRSTPWRRTRSRMSERLRPASLLRDRSPDAARSLGQRAVRVASNSFEQT